jgi:hypothetical protein
MGLKMTEQFLPDVLHATTVDRLLAVAGRGDVDQIRVARGPLLNDRPGLAQHLADLQPPPWFSALIRDDVVVALAEIGDIWPHLVASDVTIAWLEHRANSGTGKA